MTPPPDEPAPPGRTLLLVEDNPDDVELTTRLIEETGDTWHIEVCHRLATAHERLARGGIDVVLMDMSLPDGSGPQAVERTVARAGGVPVIVMTGSVADEVGLQRAREAGARDCLWKGQTEAGQLRDVLRKASAR